MHLQPRSLLLGVRASYRLPGGYEVRTWGTLRESDSSLAIQRI